MKIIKIYLISICICLIFNFSNAQNWYAIGNGLRNPNTHPVVNALLSYDSLLFAGGGFDTAGARACQNIAQWDGMNWSNLGSGIHGEVFSLAVYNGKVYLGGWYLDSAGGNSCSGITCWDGSSWSGVGPGIPPGIRPLSGSVYCLCVYNGELYAGGYFDSIGGIKAQSIAKWNGSVWSSVGSSGLNWTAQARSMAVYQGRLYISGTFDSVGGIPANGIATWDGSSWDTLEGEKYIKNFNSLYVFDSLLFCAGEFSYSLPDFDFIVQWNNSFFDSLSPALMQPNDIVSSLTYCNGVLYAGGFFDSAEGKIANHVAAWDGASWTNLGKGITSRYTYGYSVRALAMYRGELYAGGDFDSAGGILAQAIARWGGVLVGSQEQKEQGGRVRVYPNPTSGRATLAISQQLSANCQIEVYNVFGECVLKETLRGTQGDKVIDLSSQPNGVYFYRVEKQSGERVGAGKLVIQK